MAPSPATLALDREVHEFVRRIIQNQHPTGDSRLSCPAIYDEIRRSNSSLSRKPKRLLEESIERVLETTQHDAAGNEPDGVNVVSSPEPQTFNRPSNGLNQSIVAAWSRAPANATKGDALEETGNKVDRPNGDPPRKKRKRGLAVESRPPTHVNLADLGGLDDIVRQFRDLLFMTLMFPESYASANMQPTRGVLIHGPPGCGKTTLANCIGATFGVSFIEVSAPSVVSGMSGESEKALRDHFEDAKKAAPCILFIDEIDAITPKRENSERQMEKRIVAQLATCMDDLDFAKSDGKPVVVLAATNRPDSLDPALRRAGRFDKEIHMSVPTQLMRQKILATLTRTSPISPDVDLVELATRTPGFVGADLRDLVSTAYTSAAQRAQETLISAAASSESTLDDATTLCPSADDSETATLQRLIQYRRTHPHLTPPTITLTQADFLSSLPRINPSALREGFATIPDTRFSSIGALTPLITQLTNTIIQPILQPALFASLGIAQVSGTLFFGPPGCGKTLLAKALANASAANFISVKGPELLNKYVGESERAVRQLFHRARASVPVIIFFDEIDGLVPSRDRTSNDASTRVVNTLLTELDGVGDSRNGVYIVAATNRPDLVDAAILRPGRLEDVLYVGLPDADGRVEILRALCKSLPNFEFTEKMEEIARLCEGFSGADLMSLKRMAGSVAVQRCLSSGYVLEDGTGETTMVDATPVVTVKDFEHVRTKVRKSVSKEDVQRYEAMRTRWERKARI